MAASFGFKQLEILNNESTNQFWAKVNILINTTINSIDNIDIRIYNVNLSIKKIVPVLQQNEEESKQQLVRSGSVQKSQAISKVEQQYANAFEQLTQTINSTNNEKNKEKLTQLKDNLSKQLELALLSIFDEYLQGIMELKVATVSDDDIQNSELDIQKETVQYIIAVTNLFEVFEQVMFRSGTIEFQTFIEDQLQKLAAKLMELYNFQEQKLRKFIKKSTLYHLVKDKFEQVKLLFQIPFIQNQTNQRYNSILRLIESLVTEKSNEITRIIPLLEEQKQKDVPTLTKFKEAIRGMKELSWVQEQSAHFYQQTQQNLQQMLDNIIDQLNEEIKGKSIDLDNIQNFKMIEKVWEQIQQVKQIAQIINVALNQINYETLKLDIEGTMLKIKKYIEKKNNTDYTLERSDCFSLASFYDYLILIKQNTNFIQSFQLGTQPVKLYEEFIKLIKDKQQSFKVHFYESLKFIEQYKEKQPTDEESKSESFSIEQMEHQQKLQKACKSIEHILKVINEMKQNYQVIWKIFSDNDRPDEEMKEAIIRAFEVMKDRLNQTFVAQSMVLFHQSLKILKHFRFLDPYIKDSSPHGMSLSNEYNEWLTKLNLNPNVVYVSAKSDIDEQNYKKVNLTLREQKILNDIESQQTIVKIQGLLKRKCQEHLREIQRFIRFDEPIDYHQAESLNDRANELIMIKEQIDKHHISEEYQKINECVENIFKKIIQNNSEIIQNIKKQILMKRYSEAYAQLKSTSKIIGQFNIDINQDEIGSQLIALNELKQQLLDKLTLHSEEYKSIEISKYQSERPKELIENLSTTKDLEFQTQTLAIEIAIQNKYNAEIEQISTTIKNGDSSQETRKKLTTLEKSLDYLSQKLYTSIKPNIDQIIQELEKDIRNQQKKIDTLISNESDLGKLSNALAVRKYDLDSDTKQKINDTFQEHCFIAQKLINTDIKKLMDENLRNIWLMQQDPVSQQITSISTGQYQKLIGTLRKSFDSVVRSIIYRLTDQSISNKNQIELQQQGIDPNIQNKDDIQISQILAEYFNFRRAHPEIQKDIINDFEKKITQLALQSTVIFKQQEERFAESIKNEEIAGACKTIVYQRRTQKILLNFKRREFLDEIKTIGSNETIEEFSKQIEKNSYEQNCKSVGAIIVKAQIEIMEQKEFVNDATRYIDKERKLFYSDLRKNLNYLEDATLISEDLKANVELNIVEVKDQCIKKTEENIQKIYDKTIELSQQFSNLNASSDNQSLKDFGVYYENLKCIQEFLPIKKKEAKKAVDDVSSTIEKTIGTIKQRLIQKDTEVKEIAEKLTVFQKIKENIPSLEKLAGSTIKDVLINVQVQSKEKTSEEDDKVVKLQQALKGTTEGTNLVSQQTVFEGLERALFNEKIQKMKIEDVLKEMEEDNEENNINDQELYKFHKTFQTAYTKLINKNLVPPQPTIEKIRHSAFNMSRNYQGKVMSPQQKNTIPKLMSHIFALWTLMDCENYFQVSSGGDKEEGKKYLLQPHAAQIVSIFRIFGLGYSKVNVPSTKYHPIKVEQIEKNLGQKPQLFDNLVQIKTGEGKSITLAVVSIIFALWGYDVSCACFSEYLSKRDHASFQKLFQFLGVSDQIYYGTFNSICERYINKDGQIRDLVLSRVLQNRQIKTGSLQVEKPRILLIDEVDVFFSKEFYSQAYCPRALISDPKISELLDYIWSVRDTKPTFQEVKTHKAYTQCQQLFSEDYKKLLDEAIKDIVYDLSEYKNHDYVVKNGQIGYKDQDQISFKQKFGYKTVFAYYLEHEKGLISATTLEENKQLGINCGEFSYAEVPLYFTLTMGVTGTLKSLSESEKNIIQNVFKIVNCTYFPSVYGKSNLIWKTNRDRIKIVDQIQYFNTIVNQISDMLKGTFGGKRAVIVFFKNEKRLKDFLLSSQFDAYKNNCQLLTEKVDESEKERFVLQASYPGMVTLSTPSFGRGTDFICRDKQVEQNGGVHVIQTYLSESKSEFLQIRGRTSRQGNKGSYTMVLLDFDLNEFDIDRAKIDEVIGDYHKLLKEHRNKKIGSQQKEDTTALNNIKKMHESSLHIKSLIIDGKSHSDKEIAKFLLEINKGPASQNAVKTLLMMDATGSMGSMINKTKSSIDIMFQRASVILEQHDLDTNLILIQIGCYRNYSSGKDQILEYSPWETKRQNLNQFMKNIGPSGGQGNEAIEVALQHANHEADHCGEVPLHQVFLIGDAAPNTKQEVLDKRKGHGEQYWLGTKFGPPTTSDEQFLQLSKKKIDLFSFYVVPHAKPSFDRLICGSGKSSHLDVNNEAIGQITLTNTFVNQILYKVGEINGGADLGKKLIAEYKKQYAQ